MPDWRNEIREILGHLRLDPARESEIVEELGQHLQDKYDELIQGGSTVEDARQKVLEDLHGGSLAEELKKLLKPPSRAPLEDSDRGGIATGLWKDLVYGARLLRLNPGFTIVAVLSLALGIGANTAIFQLIDAVRLRTLPVQEPERIAEVKIAKNPPRTGAFYGSNPQFTYAMWEGLQERQQAFSQMAAWGNLRLNLNQGGEARYAFGVFVSGEFFSLLGVQPLYGRLISETDDRPGCGSPGVVLNEAFWTREFGGNPAAIGRKIMLDGRPFEIIGITPSSFFGMEVGRRFDLALPICAEPIFHPEKPFVKDSQAWWLGAVGRLKPGWTMERASAQVKTISRDLFESTLPPDYDALDKKAYREFTFEAVPAGAGISSLRRRYANPLWMLLAISGLVLLIACANLANLMVARATARQKEMAVRLALGASRRRLIRQLLSESFLLAAIGALFGVVLAQVLSRILVSFISTQSNRYFLDLQLDWRILAFTTGLAALTCILFGLSPAFEATRTAPGEAMKAQGRGLTAGKGRFGLRRTLVVSQVALSLVLLVGSLLFVRTLRNLMTLDAGFEQSNVLVTLVDLSPLNLPQENRMAYKLDLLERIRQLPNVTSAAAVGVVPMSGSGWNENINVRSTGIQRQIANFNQVSSGYFNTMGTPILSGRDFNERDTPTSPTVAIVTETFARKFFKGANPVGHTFSKVEQGGKPDRVFQIVGLVKDSKYREMREEFTPIVYVAETQDPEPYPEIQMMIRSPDPERMIATVKRTISDLNPSIVLRFWIFRTLIREGLLRERLMATLSGFFGFLAAVLAMTGLYGVISYMVVRRRNEIGIRMALGANARAILSMILREAATLLGIGLAVGIVLSLIAGLTAQALLFGLRPSDPLTLALAVIGLAIVAVIASLLPAQRAATLNPMQALRQE